jgi:hypothetical protein
MPNVWYAMAKLLVDYLVWINALSFSLEVTHAAPIDEHKHMALACAVCATFWGTFLCASSYWGAWSIIAELHHPFQSWNVEAYNTDALLGSTERCLFAQLRSNYDRQALAAAIEEQDSSLE